MAALNISMEGDQRIAKDLADYLSDPVTLLPEPIPVEQVVEQAGLLHSENDGATYNVYFGDMAGLPLYAVSLYPERTKRHRGKTVPTEILRQFVESNLDLLADPRNSVGLWYSPGKKTTYLDVSATLPAATPDEQSPVIQLAQDYNQIAVFDLVNFLEIKTGGTGKRITGLPVETERLPRLQRLMEQV